MDAKALVAQAVIRDARIVTIGFGSRNAHGQICPALERNLPERESGVAGLLEGLRAASCWK